MPGASAAVHSKRNARKITSEAENTSKRLAIIYVSND